MKQQPLNASETFELAVWIVDAIQPATTREQQALFVIQALNEYIILPKYKTKQDDEAR